VSEYWIKKLDQYLFPATNITSTKDKAKIIKDIKDAASELPRATAAEMKQYAEESKRFVAMVEKEDKTNIQELKGEMKLLVNLASKLPALSAQDKKTAKRARQKERRKAAKEAEDDDSDSDSDDGSEEESGSDRE
jgi:16S rRNA C1402 (ribose-2'-O) methylase RsmI